MMSAVRRVQHLTRTVRPYHASAVVSQGQAITMVDGALQVPDTPVIPYIEGDGTGKDIWEASQVVFDGAVEKAYGGKKKVEWLEVSLCIVALPNGPGLTGVQVLAGEKAFRKTGEWLPDATIEAYKKYLVGIKGPLTTPIGGGIRSLNVALRQELDLFICLRPVRWFKGVPSPIKNPQDVNMTIFRENCEDIYAGIEFPANSPEAGKFYDFLKEMGVSKGVRFPNSSGYGIKPISQEGSERLVRASIEYGIANGHKSVTLVHKGNIMKSTEGFFKKCGYSVATREFRDKVVTERETWILGNKDNGIDDVEANAKAIDPGYDMMTPGQQDDIKSEVQQCIDSIYSTHGNGKWKSMFLVRDAIADITLQQVLTRPKDFDIIATMNLNGDYLSDALAAQVGGIGIAPGGNINSLSGHAIFEATHGTAPKYAGLDKVNPGSVILSGEMMFRHMGWSEAADLIIKGIDTTIGQKRVTYDFERMMDGASLLKCSEFGQAIVDNM